MKTKNQPVLCYIGGRCAYFTTQALNKQWGDDWDDAPYEHNAEVPYEPHVAGEDWEITRVVFEAPLDTPDAGVSNSGYSVEMINRGDVAWLVPDQWGISKDEEVYGMNFPDLPLKSEYCEKEEMKLAIKNRLKAISGYGIKHVFLMNHHGGKGQMKLVEDLSEENSDQQMKVHAIKTYQFNDLKEDEGFYNVGGHAGYSETTWVMAFRPELVDLSEQEEGELMVRKTGILHNKPQIEPRWNPRNIDPEVAGKLRRRVIGNFIQYINQQQ